jgi:cytosine permease
MTNPTSTSPPGSDLLPLSRWPDKTGPWLGVGASPAAMVLGATIAQRYNGPIPLLSILLGLALMAAFLWFQGIIGLNPPVGQGKTFTQVTPQYFSVLMQRVLGVMLTISMVGWYGFNVGLGGAALSALLHLPGWLGPVLIGVPVLLLTLRGMRIWNVVATVATVSALLVVLVVVRLSARTLPFTMAMHDPLFMLADVAVFVGYAAVFSIRSPDFSAGLSYRGDLSILVALFCGAMIGVALAGVGLQQGTGSADLVGVLAGPDGLAVGNLLVAMAVIAPAFTTLFSGVPALRAATGLPVNRGMVFITVIGLGLAISRFDLWLRPWLVVLAATLPPITVTMVWEAAHRRFGGVPRIVPLWTWLPGALLAMSLTIGQQTFAPLIGLGLTLILTGIWHYRCRD